MLFPFLFNLTPLSLLFLVCFPRVTVTPVPRGEVEDDGDEDVMLLVERTLSALLLPVLHFLSQSLHNVGA